MTEHSSTWHMTKIISKHSSIQYDIAHIIAKTKAGQDLNSQQTTHNLPLWTSYGVSVMEYLPKMILRNLHGYIEISRVLLSNNICKKISPECIGTRVIFILNLSPKIMDYHYSCECQMTLSQTMVVSMVVCSGEVNSLRPGDAYTRW